MLRALIAAIAMLMLVGAVPAGAATAPAVKAVALTLEDLDNPADFAAVLRLCRDEGIKVTFFISGEALAGLPVKEAAAAGHEVGNHGLRREYWAGAANEAIAADLAAGAKAVQAAAGAMPKVIRPPYNYYGDNFRRAAATLAPAAVVKGLDTNDWFIDSPAALAEQLGEAVGGGETVNVNMGVKVAAAALPDIVRELKKRGFELVTVSELLRRLPPPAVVAPAAERPPASVARVVRRGEGGRLRVALTFDDGGAEWRANEILDVLREAGVRSTFFLLGEWVREHPGMVRRMAAEGHELANHSYSHPWFGWLDEATMREEILAAKAAFEEVAGRGEARLFRPPYGVYDGTLAGVLGELGYRGPVLWDVDSRDWTGLGQEAIVERVLADTGPGSIILFHLHGQNTAAALREIIAALRARGYEMTTVGDL